MTNSTNPNWIAYRVIKYGCGEPYEIIGYYQTKEKAAIIAAHENGDKKPGNGFCCHDGGKCDVQQITIES